MTRRIIAAPALALVVACASGPPGPAPLDTKNEQCATCRMAVSDARFAAQLVAPGEEPRFFDDIGCLRTFLTGSGATIAKGAVAYVADHRTREWRRADTAVYTRATVDTPMGSHLMAHADAGSRDADADARGGTPVPLADLFGPGGPPRGGAR